MNPSEVESKKEGPVEGIKKGKEVLKVEDLSGKEEGRKKSSATKIVINEIPQDLMDECSPNRGFRSSLCQSRERLLPSSFTILIILSIILLTVSIVKLIVSTNELIEYQNTQEVYLLDPMSESRESKNVRPRVTSTTKRPVTRRGSSSNRRGGKVTTTTTTTTTTRRPSDEGKGRSKERTEGNQEPVTVIYSRLTGSTVFASVAILSLLSLSLSRRFSHFSTNCLSLLSHVYLSTISLLTVVILLNVSLIVTTVSEEEDANSNSNIDLSTLVQLTASLIFFTAIFTANQLVWIQQLEQRNVWNKRIYASQDLSIC